MHTWFTNNLWIKTGALALAIGLWFYVAGEESVEDRLKAPIQVEISPDMVVAEQRTDSLNIIVRGRKDVISKINREKLSYKIDLASYKEPKVLVLSVDKKMFYLDPEIDMLRIIPEQIEIKIDRLMKKIMPVKVVTEGEPAQWHEITGFIIDPVAVRVEGPESYIKDLIYIDTEPVDVTGRQKSFRKMVPLKSIPMVGGKIPPQFVEVVVKIEEKSKIKSKR